MKLDGVLCATGGKSFDPDSNVVVLVHGAGGDHTVWKYQTRFLAHHGFAPLAIDLPGHGQTPGPFRPSVEEQASWFVGWLKESIGVPVTVVGHSMGSLIALLAAASGEDVVKSVVLAGTTERMAVHPDLLSSSAEGTDDCLKLLRSWMHADPAGGHVEPGMWLNGQDWTTTTANGFAALNNDFHACNDFVAGNAASAIEVPTLVIAGEKDRMTPPRFGRALADRIEGSQFELIKDAGHMMMVEQSQRFNNVLTSFLRSTQ